MRLPLRFRSVPPVRTYDLDAASLYLFDHPKAHLPCDPRPAGESYLAISQQHPYTSKSSDEFTIPRANKLEVRGKGAHLRFDGEPRGDCVARMCANAWADSESDLDRLLTGVRFEPTKNGFAVNSWSPQIWNAACVTEVHARIPEQQSLKIQASWSAAELYALEGPIDVSTTHGRLKLIDCTGTVKAVSHTGIVDFSAVRGDAVLKADGEIGSINLYLSAPSFVGTLSAKAEGDIRVRVAPGFTTGIQVTVDREKDFVNRAHLAMRVHTEIRGGRAVFNYGAENPPIRLEAIGGPVIIDTDGSN